MFLDSLFFSGGGLSSRATKNGLVSTKMFRKKERK